MLRGSRTQSLIWEKSVIVIWDIVGIDCDKEQCVLRRSVVGGWCDYYTGSLVRYRMVCKRICRRTNRLLGGECTFLHLHAMRGNPNLNASQLCPYGDARVDASEISQQDFAPSSELGVSAFK